MLPSIVVNGRTQVFGVLFQSQQPRTSTVLGKAN